MTESVSVVITCYNLQRYIQEAVSSVLAQDYPGEVQIVVVDDCSTDESRNILLGIVGIDLILQDKNGGVMTAMIAGLRAASHDVVFFLDGDDVWHPQKLSSCMVDFGEDTKLCTHDLWYMDAESNNLARSSHVSEVLSVAAPNLRDELVARCILNHLDYVWLGSAFGVRRSLGMIAEFIVFCEARSYLQMCYQDWPLAVWIALQKQGSMSYIDQKLFGYRLHDSNYSGSTQTLQKLQRNRRKALDTIRLIEEIMIEKSAEKKYIETTQWNRMHYALLLASTEGSRRELLFSIFRNVSAVKLNLIGLKTIIKVGLALFLGPEKAHFIIESFKGTSASA